MNKQIFDVNNLRVASPCSVNWKTMSGDERVRHCHSCELNVYNISEMTNAEVENLIAEREGRICIRLYKRADGTVLTKDCPIGFRAYQKRAIRFAGAALAAILGMVSVSFGQKSDEKTSNASEIKIIRTENQEKENVLSGTVTDSMGAVILETELKLYKEDKKKSFKAKSNAEGVYSFKNIPEGTYILEAKRKGFAMQKITELKINNSKNLEINIELQSLDKSVTVGILAAEPLIDVTSSGITSKITQKQIERLPH